jgi:hypothetical protein
MSEAMDRGREMHEAIAKNLFDAHMTKRQLEGRQAEDRMHRQGPPAVVYIDGESADGKLRALLDAHGDQPRIIVISDHHANGLDDELKALINGKKVKTISYGDIIKMPPTEFIQEHDNLPPGTCRCEFDPYDDGDTEPSTHYKRTCLFCKQSWFGLHCPHDGHQRPCPNCGKKPITLK